MGDVLTGNTPSTSISEYYSGEGVPWITPSDINEFPTATAEKHLSAKGLTVARTVPAGSILCTCIASIGKNALAESTCGFNQQINALVPRRMAYDSYFLYSESSFWSEEMIRNTAAGAMQIVNKTEFSNLLTNIPSLPEQRLIGAFFRELDDLITLHQREHVVVCGSRRLSGFLLADIRSAGDNSNQMPIC